MFAASVPTFHHQAQLPKLPIPTIAESTQLFLDTVKVFEYNEAKKLSAELAANENAQEVQDCIVTADSKSFVEEYWLDAYLSDRRRCAVNVNPFFVFEEDPTPLRSSQIARGASLIISALKFASAVREQRLEPDMWRSIPMCMFQYPRLFSTSRAACHDRDQALEFKDAKHIVVISRNQFYWFDVMTPDGNHIGISEDVIAENLQLILEDAAVLSDKEAAENAVGILTSQDREQWATHRQVLAKMDVRNKESLDIVDSAMFVVCLDHVEPMDAEPLCENALHGTSIVKGAVQVGTCQNRWFDKSMQIIVNKNGSAGLNFEHSVVDGHSVLRFASDVYTDTILRFAKTIRGDVKELLVGKNISGVDSAPRKIVWRLSADLRAAIRAAEAEFGDVINQIEAKTLEFSGYGKRWIVRQNLSPDAYVQAMFQLAYYQLYGKVANTYETVQTKKFRHGRTEAARPLTIELSRFVKTFCSDASAEEKVHAIHRAVAAHVEVVKWRAEGVGFERHLGVLEYTAKRQAKDIPPFFECSAWKKLSRNIISTSNCGNPSLRMFGFGPVCEEGYGIGYLIKDDSINFCISSWHRQTDRFTQVLKSCFEEMKNILDANTAGSFTLTTSGQRAVLRESSLVLGRSQSVTSR